MIGLLTGSAMGNKKTGLDEVHVGRDVHPVQKKADLRSGAGDSE